MGNGYSGALGAVIRALKKRRHSLAECDADREERSLNSELLRAAQNMYYEIEREEFESFFAMNNRHFILKDEFKTRRALLRNEEALIQFWAGWVNGARSVPAFEIPPEQKRQSAIHHNRQPKADDLKDALQNEIDRLSRRGFSADTIIEYQEMMNHLDAVPPEIKDIFTLRKYFRSHPELL